MEYVIEPKRKTPVLLETDVLVVGGGVAGCVAALAAARTGVQVTLIERNRHLGGFFDTRPGSGEMYGGLVLQDGKGNWVSKGIGWEIIKRLVSVGGAIPMIKRKVKSNHPKLPLDTPNSKYGPFIDYETLKMVLFDMMGEAAVRFILYTFGVGVIKKGNVIEGVFTETKSGRDVILAKVIVDATGDADVVSWSDDPFDKSPPEKLYQIQGVLFVGGINTAIVKSQIKNHLEKNDYAYVITPESSEEIPERFEQKQIHMVLSAEGFEVSDDNLTVRKRTPGSASILSTGMRPCLGRLGAGVSGDGTNVFDLTRAEVEIRRAITQKLDKLRRTDTAYKDSYILPPVHPLGIRETRRLVGEYVINEDDIKNGAQFEDVVAKGHISFDHHYPDGSLEHRMPTKAYDIPYRALLPQNTKNLVVAGRCISCTHKAQAALRKVPVVLATGQSAGTAAALSVQYQCSLRDLDLQVLRRALRKDNHIV